MFVGCKNVNGDNRMETEKTNIKEGLIRDLEETRDLNIKSIAGIKKLVDDAPNLTEANRAIDNQIEAIRQVPVEEFKGFPQTSIDFVKIGRNQAKYYFDQVYQAQQISTGTATSAATSGAAEVYKWADDQANIKDNPNFKTAFAILHAEATDKGVMEKRRNEISALLLRLLPADENRFIEILAEAEKCKADLSKVEPLALSMRTLLEKIKSGLKKRLSSQAKENKILPAVADELVDPTKSTPAYSNFLAQIEVFKNLSSKLTNIGKWSVKSAASVDSLTYEWEVLMYSILLPLKNKI
jgi:hypothetical protein